MNASQPSTTCTQQLLADSSFESQSSVWAAHDQASSVTLNWDLSQTDGREGSGYIDTSTTTTGGSVWQNVAYSPAVGDSYEAAVWVRAAAQLQSPVTGSLTLSATGGTAESDSTSFSVGTTWTMVSAPLTIANSGHTHIAIVLVMNTTGVTYDWDAGTLLPAGLSNASFEAGSSPNPWLTSTGASQQPYHSTKSMDGGWFDQMNTTQQGGIYQNLSMTIGAGQSYELSAWVRADTSTNISGYLALLAGGSSPSNATYFTASQNWSLVQVGLDLQSGSYSSLQAQLIISTLNKSIDIDGLSLVNPCLVDASMDYSDKTDWAVLWQPSGHTATYSFTNGSSGWADSNGWMKWSNAGGQTGIGQLWNTTLAVGSSWQAGVWLKSDDGTALTGTLAACADGTGSSICGNTRFSVQGAYSWVTAPLYVTSTGFTRLRLQIYLNPVGHVLDVDAATWAPADIASALPGAPTSVSASSPGNTGTATVNWSAPTSYVGNTVNSYSVTPFLGGVAQTSLTQSGIPSTTTSANFSGLTAAGPYTFAVTATNNSYGTGAPDTSNAVTTISAPGAVTGLSATPGNTVATVSWTAPSSNGSPITGYTVTPYIGSTAQSPTNVDGSTTSTTITGLSNGTTYTFQVTASNNAGTGPAATSNSVTPATVPGAPGNVSATGGNAQALVTWSAPSSDGGSVITGYTVTPYIGSTAQSPTAVGGQTTSATVTGLSNGTAYTFQVTATNSAGTGPPGTSGAATPATVPDAPTGLTATGGDSQAVVQWTASASDGGSAITGYTVTPYIGSSAQAATNVSASTTTATITGLSNGTTYTFQVTANNAVGVSAAATSNAVTPMRIPDAPTNVVATSGNQSASITWSPPVNDGGDAITGYQVTPYIGSAAQTPSQVDGSTTTLNLTGLSNGTTYTFQVAAINSVGVGPSATSNPVTPATVPDAPTGVTATAGDAQAAVSWTAPTSDGGSSITGYTVTPYVGSTAQTPVTVSGTSTTITGLSNGSEYTFAVTATNAGGTGAPATSKAVLPGSPPDTYANTVLKDGPVAYYRLDESSGATAADTSGAGNNATYSGGTSLGQRGALDSNADTAVSLDGSTGHVLTPVSSGGWNAMSVELWFKSDSLNAGTNPRLAADSHTDQDNRGFQMAYRNGGNSGTFDIGTSGTSGDAEWAQQLQAGVWHYCVGTYDGSMVRFYLDGTLVGSAPASGTINPSGLAIDLGRDPAYAGDYFNGNLDEVAIYNYALSQVQISAHLAASGDLPTTPTVLATWAGPTSAHLSWTSAHDSALGYTITPVENGVDQTPITVGGTLTSVTIPGLTAGASYKFLIVENTQFGDSAPADPFVHPSASPGWNGLVDGIGVYAGYGDSEHGGSYAFPVGWPNPGQNQDYGAVLLSNSTNTDISVDSVVVTIGSYQSTWAIDYTVPAGSYVVVVGDDSSEDGGNNCTQSSVVPTVQISVGGQTATYQDSQQVLTSGGVDRGSCPNNSEYSAWNLLGGPASGLEALNNPSENSTSCQCAEPVDTATGDFWETQSDISITERGAPLAVSRTYNSLTAGYDGPFGFGWQSNIAMYLATDPQSGAIVVHQETGATVSFSETSSGSYEAPPRVLATLVRNADGTFTFTRNNQTTYRFDWRGELISQSDRNGNTLTYTYSSGQLSSIADQTGRSLTYTYDANGHVTQVADSTGRTVGYAYDTSGNLTQVTDVNGGLHKFTYDGNHLLITETDANGGTLTNAYDSAYRVTSQVDAMNRTTSFSYQGQTTTVTNPAGHVTQLQYDNGELITKIEGYGTAQAATWIYAYDPQTLGISSTTDPNNQTTTRTYDARGNLLSSTDPLNRTTSYSYDELNDVLTVTDPTHVTTTYAYDARGNLVSSSRPLVGTSEVQVTTYHRDDSSHPGDVTSITDPETKTTLYGHDAYGNLISTTDPAGGVTSSTYNALGWITSSTSPRGNIVGCNCASQYTTTYSYADPSSGAVDEFGDVRVVTDPLGHTTTKAYDANRNVTATTDGNGNVTGYTYDADNELTSTTRADSTITSTDYYPDGTVQHQKDGKTNTILSYTYNSLGQPTTSGDALGNQTTYAYDGAGNLLSTADPGGSCAPPAPTGCTTYSYDPANQLTAIVYSDGVTPSVSNITYNPDGQRTGMTDGTGQWSWSYDSLGRLISVTEGANGTVGYQYDLRNLVTQLTYPDNNTVSRGYDNAGRMTSTTDWLGNTTNFGYDPNSNLTSETMPTTGSPVVDSFSFDAADQMTNISDVQGSNTIFAASYGRDGNGQLTSDSSAVAGQNAYGYTALNQLCYAGSTATASCATPPVGSQPFSYDAADNMTGLGGTSQSFNSADQLLSSGSTTSTYDSRGNRTSTTSNGVTVSDGYDQAGNLCQVGASAGSCYADVNSNDTAYCYNGDGLRMAKVTVGSCATPSMIERFSWDLSGSLPLMLSDGASDYVCGPDGLPLEKISSSGTLWYHHDQVGSTRVVTDASGTVAGSYTFDPYGNELASTGSLMNQPFLFAGEYFDTETGAYYLRERYYGPDTGQFLASDPAAEATRAPYSYAYDDPLDRSDPLGLSGCGPAPWDWGNCVGDAAGWLQKNVIQPLGDFGTTHVFQLCLSGSLPNLVGAGGPWGAIGGSVCLTGNTHHFGFMVSTLQAPQGFSLGLGIDFNAAEACDPRQLQGPFQTIGGNLGPANGSVYGQNGEINGVTGGLGVGFPVGGYRGITSSRYFPIWN